MQESMKYNVTSIPNFTKELKRLAKKYPSILDDVLSLTDILEITPLQGVPLGNSLYKVRLSIASKGQGKSGGARVITCVKIIGAVVVLVAIYDKSERETITPKELDKLLKLIP